MPLFNGNMCQGPIVSSRDTGQLAEIFGVPVLACSLFDSDVLTISYSDPERGIKADYARPNVPEYMEFDWDTYQTQFPEFLVDLCGEDARERLREIWASEEYVFADDKMYDICGLLGAQALYSGDEIPEGFIPIT
ncbi:hypothetical protein GMD88_15080 [Pseudoflavonifractor sp. BIOML-A6]|nr:MULTISPECIES: hypothetical protein [unclassified Pseudoflavonifractor]MTQ97754.1 hypothetical protein [Pseudoflavonifractor sp. BIOML-A16]MTR06741.1 hypothetical protein [Pseudoflavonifractor sp. BIOML-A15]MTR33263.1 hypothetical protein [Pseudoflavonifractor sp. BIOML-A14]MTR73993.1 hypothetical protein [Pseudoflavonifractor sp. BIOML-A18]MTS64763.1 hypothetical protein [Pseudoflavonifractor sp. BIOML-A5]MTS72955.1 hypothetical protein [Pseudoflavonifractor sp. BIOML-A8]MTS90384.1 hypoth